MKSHFEIRPCAQAQHLMQMVDAQRGVLKRFFFRLATPLMDFETEERCWKDGRSGCMARTGGNARWRGAIGA